MQKNKGFTLIELLIVIAIIGVLASIVLASLNNAREKGNDKAIMTNLKNAQNQAEINYNTRTINPNTYINICSEIGMAGGVRNIYPMVEAASKAAGLGGAVNNTYTTAGSSTTVTCHVDGSGLAWAVEVPLSEGTNQMWCVDSTGRAVKNTGSKIEANNADCI